MRASSMTYARALTGGAPARAGAAATKRDRGDEQQPSHLIRTFSPMKSEVDVTFGFSLWIRATETPVLVEMTPNVSPALTLQYSRLFAVVETCGDGGMRLVVVVVRGLRGARARARIARARRRP